MFEKAQFTLVTKSIAFSILRAFLTMIYRAQPFRASDYLQIQDIPSPASQPMDIVSLKSQLKDIQTNSQPNLVDLAQAVQNLFGDTTACLEGIRNNHPKISNPEQAAQFLIDYITIDWESFVTMASERAS